MPYDLGTRAAGEYLDRIYQRELALADRFVVTGRYPEGFRGWFAERARGFEARDVDGVLVYERSSPDVR